MSLFLDIFILFSWPGDLTLHGCHVFWCHSSVWEQTWDFSLILARFLKMYLLTLFFYLIPKQKLPCKAWGGWWEWVFPRLCFTEGETLCDCRIKRPAQLWLASFMGPLGLHAPCFSVGHQNLSTWLVRLYHVLIAFWVFEASVLFADFEFCLQFWPRDVFLMILTFSLC